VFVQLSMYVLLLPSWLLSDPDTTLICSGV
jgi:hypothetical protein